MIFVFFFNYDFYVINSRASSVESVCVKVIILFSIFRFFLIDSDSGELYTIKKIFHNCETCIFSLRCLLTLLH